MSTLSVWILVCVVIIVAGTHIKWRGEKKMMDNQIENAKSYAESEKRERSKSDDRYFDYVCDAERKTLSRNNDMLRSAIKKLIGDQSTYMDSTFIYKGSIYEARSFELHKDPGKSETLTVEFYKEGDIYD